MPDLLPDKLTALPKQDALNALYAGWISLFGKAPDNEDSLRVLMSQWALETGWGKAMHNYNFGNFKSVDGDGYDYCLFRCFEKVNGKTVWYDPPSPVCRFRAFKTAASGAEDYLKSLHKRFNLSWPAVLSGDPAKFSHALKQQGYYTADESAYTGTLTSIFKGLKSAKIDKTGAPAPGKGSLDPKDSKPPAPVVTKNITDGVGAAAARVALTRSLSAHGWTLDGGNAWTITDPLVSPDTLHAIKLLPGDAITIVTATGPRNGRVATVILATGEYADSSSGWVASASGPDQQVIIEQLKFESSPRDFDASLKDGGKPLATWKDGEKRPATGHAWIVGILRTSTVQRGRVDKMADADRTKLKISAGDAAVTPGTVLSRSAKKNAGDPTVQDVPIPDDKKLAEKKKALSQGGPKKPPIAGTPNDDAIPPPVQIDPHTVKIHIGSHAGRVGFTIKAPAAKKPAAPAGSTPQAPKADGKRDAFILAAMNFVGTPYLANSADPSKGVDGVGLISICLQRVGILKKGGDPLTVDALNGMFQNHGGTATHVPDNIQPGDIAWFGSGTHDVDAQQHPMIYLGGDHVLGPIGDAAPNGGGVQVIQISKVPEHFAGWAHIEDIGTDTEHTAHPGPAPKSSETATPALLPAGPPQRYDALKAVSASQKGTWNDAKGAVNLVAVKNMHDRSVILPNTDDWNDTIFAAFLDDDGNKCCVELRASINPGTDKDSTGTWQLMDGSYQFKMAPGDGVDAQTLQPSGDVEGWLDEEGAGSLRPGDLKEIAETSGAGSGAAAPAPAAADSSSDSSDSSDSSSPDDTTTAAPTDSTTAAPTDSTTEAPTDSTTEAPTASTTEVPTASTTLAPTASTTLAPTASTTLAPTASTTLAPTPTTTLAPTASTTLAPSPTTTLAPTASTTLAPSPTTTFAPLGATTAAPASTTTAAPAQTTTAAAAATTTIAPAPATTTTAHPPTTTTANNGKVSSSNITVNGKHFADWFNTDFRPQYPGNHPTLLLWKKPAPMFPSKVNKANFCTVFDNVKYLWADQLTVAEFLGFFGIFYNETGGSMQPIGEVGNAKYMFEATPGGKASYNTSKMNRQAGDQLKAQGVISDQGDVDAWNSATYPADAPQNVQDAAKECDFWKFRGHGFIQTTFHQNYVRDCNPALKAAGYGKTVDDMSSADLENAIKTDPKVSLPMVKSFFKNIAGFSKVNQDPPVWYDTGRAVSGQKPYGDLYQWRLETIFAAMKKAGFQVK